MKVDASVIAAIEVHAIEGYPNEICGFLIGPAGGETITESRRTPNVAPENQARRYLIDPREQIRVQRDCDANGLDILGYYHTHPDHPAQPSSHDAEPAWPGPLYMIVSVRQGQVAEANGFVATDFGGPFRSEPIEIV